MQIVNGGGVLSGCIVKSTVAESPGLGSGVVHKNSPPPTELDRHPVAAAVHQKYPPTENGNRHIGGGGRSREWAMASRVLQCCREKWAYRLGSQRCNYAINCRPKSPQWLNSEFSL